MTQKTTAILTLVAASVTAATLALALGSSAVAAPARSPSLEEKEFFAEAQKSLDEKAKTVNEKCGTTITARIDVDSFVQADAGTTGIKHPCENALLAVGEVCRTDEGKKTVAEKITSYTCRHTASDSQAELSKKQLIAHVNPKSGAIKGKKPGSYSWLSAVKELL